MCSKFSTAPEEFKDLLDEMSKLSWKLLEMVPPLVSETIYDTPFCKEWHAKEVEPEWNKNLKDYKLVYYRPILFFSYQGKVSQKGWAGNQMVSDKRDELEQVHTVSAASAAEHAEGIKPKPGYTLYKKPQLRVQGSVNIPDEGGSTSFVPDEPVMENLPKECESGGSEEMSENSTSSYYFGLRKLL